MLDLLKQYFKIISMSLIGIAFSFSTFYILINLYHYIEIRKTFSFNYSEDITIISINKKMDLINQNINSVSLNNYNNQLDIGTITDLKEKFNICIDMLNNESYKSLGNKSIINIKDVYNLREAYENNVASKCLVGQFIFIYDVNDDYPLLRKNKSIYEMTLRNLISDTDYVKKDILNNSTYTFSTDVSSLTGKSLTRDSLYEVLKSYDKVASFLLELSNNYKDMVGVK